MFYEIDPNDGASLTFSARTRGGGGAAVGLLMKIRAGSYAGLGGGGITIDINGATGNAFDVTLADGAASNLTVSRHNTSAGSSNTLGTVTQTGEFWLWVDAPTNVLTGSLPTAYTFTTDTTTAVTMGGADSPAGTANDIDGSITLTITASTAGHWKVESVYLFQGADRPDTQAEARAVALGEALASGYTGLAFSAELIGSYDDTIGSVAGTNSGGMLSGYPIGVAGMMKDSCTIARPKITQGENTGSPVTTYYDFDEGVQCMVQDGAGSEALANLRQTGTTGFGVFFLYGVDVRNGDQLTWDSRTLVVVGTPVSDPMRRCYTMVPCSESLGGGES
jgi:hypothetical protein